MDYILFYYYIVIILLLYYYIIIISINIDQVFNQVDPLQWIIFLTRVDAQPCLLHVAAPHCACQGNEKFSCCSFHIAHMSGCLWNIFGPNWIIACELHESR